MSCHAIGSADQKQRHVRDCQGPFGLRGKVDVTGRIQQRQRKRSGLHPGHLREDRNAPLPLQLMGIQKCISMIHSSCLADRAAQIRQISKLI